MAQDDNWTARVRFRNGLIQCEVSCAEDIAEIVAETLAEGSGDALLIRRGQKNVRFRLRTYMNGKAPTVSRKVEP